MRIRSQSSYVTYRTESGGHMLPAAFGTKLGIVVAQQSAVDL
ncbi:MAG TPA: hypothetical protein VM166_05015 [Gemmatimonadaceae bacterium]|nr:hypothetical protein [Gemmatimonadaceae bacterium]